MPKPALQNKKVDTEWFIATLQKLGRSQRDLARFLGLDPSSILHLIHGRRNPKAQEPPRIADFLEVGVNEIFARFGLPIDGSGAKGWSNAARGSSRRRFIGAGKGVTADLDIESFLDGSLTLRPAPGGKGLRGKKTAAFPFGDKGILVARCQTLGSPYEDLDGALVFYKLRNTVEVEAIGKRALVQVLGEDDLKLRITKRGSVEGKYILCNWGGKIVEEDVRLKSTSPIVWMKL